MAIFKINNLTADIAKSGRWLLEGSIKTLLFIQGSFEPLLGVMEELSCFAPLFFRQIKTISQ